MGEDRVPLADMVEAVRGLKEQNREQKRENRRLKRWARANAILLRKQQRG